MFPIPSLSCFTANNILKSINNGTRIKKIPEDRQINELKLYFDKKKKKNFRSNLDFYETWNKSNSKLNKQNTTISKPIKQYQILNPPLSLAIQNNKNHGVIN